MLSACQTYGVEAARPLLGGDGLHGGGPGGDGDGDGGRSSSAGPRAEADGEEEEEEIIPALVNFVHSELEDWERRRYSEVGFDKISCERKRRYICVRVPCTESPCARLCGGRLCCRLFCFRCPARLGW